MRMISLVDYMRKHKLSSSEVASALGVSLSVFYKYRVGIRNPSEKVRRKIFSLYKGKVTGIRKPYDLFPKVK